MSAVHPIGGDLRKFSTPLTLKSHISKLIMYFSSDATLIRIPPVELLKLDTLKFSTTDLFIIGYFWYLIWMYPDIYSVGKSNHSATLAP